MRFLKGVSTCFRAVKGAAIIEPRIGTYGHIWTGLRRFFPVSVACKHSYLADSSNLLNSLINLVLRSGTGLAEESR